MREVGKPEYLIFGMGALGSVFGGLLQKAGCSVTYVGRGDHFRAVLDEGLKITGLWGDHYLPPEEIEGFSNPSGVGRKFPVILLCVKSLHTDEAAREASRLLEPDGIMVSIQNGLNNWETIAGHVGLERTVGSRVIFGAENLEPGTVNVSVYADKVLLGSPFVKVNEHLLRTLESDLNIAGIPSEIVSSEDLKAAIWLKVLYNCALNPLGALLEVPYGELGLDKETREILRTVLEEAFQVMTKKGVKVPFRDADEHYSFFMKRQLPATVGHRSSMLQDILKGRRTEIDALNGAISRYARELGVSTPYNDLLTAIIRFKEATQKERMM